MKKFFKEFKEFISRGNIVDLSVAVIIGAAFSAIVTALTDNIIKPIINKVLSLIVGDGGLDAIYTFLKWVPGENGLVDLEKSIFIDWGAFISAVINFIIIAFTVFCIVKAINASSKKMKQLESSLKNETSKDVREEKKAVKLQAKEQNRPFKEVWNEHLAEKKRLSEEQAKLEAEEQARKAEEEKKLHPSQEELLMDIRNLLAEQNSSKKSATTKATTKKVK